jgi:hypothetical protein
MVLKRARGTQRGRIHTYIHTYIHIHTDPALTLPDGLKEGERYAKGTARRIPVLSELERKVRQVSRDRRLQVCNMYVCLYVCICMCAL